MVKEDLFKMRLNSCENNISNPWTLKDLETVLKSLKLDKAADPDGLVNDIFKHSNIGNSVKE